MAKLTADEKREYSDLMDRAYDAYETLSDSELVRFRELGQRFEAEEDRRREWMDEAYDREEDFWDY